MDFLLKIVGNSLGFWVSSKTLEGLIFEGTFTKIILAGGFLALLNFITKPILKILFPLVLITFGLFIILFNAGLLWLTDYVFDFIKFKNLMGLILTTILIGFINLVIKLIYKILLR